MGSNLLALLGLLLDIFNEQASECKYFRAVFLNCLWQGMQAIVTLGEVVDGAYGIGGVVIDRLSLNCGFYHLVLAIEHQSSPTNAFTTTQWGKIPTSSTVTYAFATTSGSRALQDVGFNGLTDAEERSYGDYQTFLQNIQGTVSESAYQTISADPANDNYHYFRGSDFDRDEASILERYKRINMPQGNSPDTDSRTESYDTSYKTTPDVEDINQDYTLNEYEKYFHYHVSLHPGDTILGKNFIVDKRIGKPNLRNGKQGYVTWYQYRIPLDRWEEKFGSISDFSSIRFMRMYLTGFEKPIVLRFGSLDGSR